MDDRLIGTLDDQAAALGIKSSKARDDSGIIWLRINRTREKGERKNACKNDIHSSYQKTERPM